MSAHAFLPSADGATCNEMLYPEWKRCGKGPRSRAHTGTRPAPPELEFPYPPCSLCGGGTEYDEGFFCRSCGAQWDSSGRNGGWDEPDLKACGATRKPFDRPDLAPEHEGIRHHMDYCIREEGHEGNHRADEFSEWGDPR